MPPPIIALGASAGGVQALKEFFEHTPVNTGAAYVAILHLSPSHGSQLAQVLQRATQMQVMQVTARTRIEPNHVYVIPPDRHLTMEFDYIIPSQNLLIEERRAPVDIFFRSISEMHESRVVGVVLSGTGADGSMGLKRIKENGGAVFAQNPREAEFNEMPRNAIATDLVDAVLNVAEIPARILEYTATLDTVQIFEESGERDETVQHALRDVFALLRLRTGHDFSNYRRTTLMRRIGRRMSLRATPDVPAYTQYMREHPEETQALLKDLLISVTNFFRDKNPWAELETSVLPQIFDGKGEDDQVRIWVAGCATGEEAYSMAMLCAEQTAGMVNAPRVQIFATDIDEDAIATARDGLYSINDAADVSPERLSRFFTKEGDGFRIRKEIREMVLFAMHNFIKSPPFSRIDLVSCRNVLIYLNRAAQDRVMETFHFALKPDSFLLLGTAESADMAGRLYRIYNREHHIFQTNHVASPIIIVPDSVPLLRLDPPVKQQVQVARTTSVSERITYGDLHLRLLESYAPPSLVLNAEFDIVHLSERAGRYLEMTGGEPTQNILSLIRDELRMEMRSALFQAQQKSIPITAFGLNVRNGDHTELINIHVRAVPASDAVAKGFLLVVFEPGGLIAAEEAVVRTTDEPAGHHLEEELSRLRAQLRTSNEQHEFHAEELKAGNEELQAMNEELRSAGEELETGKEELQSINEELSTVNQELKVKVEEASINASNLQNLINSTDIGTIFLDRAFRVVLFTPMARSVFNLIEADYGRPLSDITNHLRGQNLQRDAETVLQKLQTIERELQTDDGRTFLTRLSPYRTEEDRIQGVVLAFVDISERKHAENAVRISEERLQRMVNVPRVGVLTFDFAGALLSANDAFLSMVGYSRADFTSGRFKWQDFTPEEHVEASRSQMESLAGTGQAGPYEKEYFCKDGSRVWLMFVAADLGDGTIVEYAIDVSERKEVEAAMRISEARFRNLTDAVPQVIWSNDAGGKANYFNQRWFDYSGLSFEASVGLGWEAIVHPDDAPASKEKWQQAQAAGEVFDTEYRLRAADGSYCWFIGRNVPIRDAGGAITGWFGTATDIEDLKQAAAALRESEERLRITMESAVDYAIINTSTDGAIDGWSRGAERIFQWTEDEILGKSVDIIFTPEDRAAGAPEWERGTAMREGLAPDERWHIRKDGSRFFMSGVMRPIYDGTLRGFVKVARDLTERQQAEESLRVSEERYRIALQSAEMGAWDWNVPTDEVMWNEQHYRMLGIAPQDGPLSASFFPGFVHPDDLNDVQSALKEAIESTGIYMGEFRIIRADSGAVRWMAGFGRSVTADGGGRSTRMVGVTYDITRRRHVEEQKEEFIGIASHELRTPLTSIKAYAQVLQDIFEEEGNTENAALMEKMDGQIDRLTELIRALLDVTRIREGRLELRKESFDLYTLLHEKAEELQRGASQRIEIVDGGDGAVTADRERIGQVVTNLLSNAVKYSAGADRIILSAKREDGRVEVCVQDFGIGMSDNVRQRVFERFYRADDATVNTYPGLGLGLYITAEIIKGHGGSIRADSETGKGSTFCFSLPV